MFRKLLPELLLLLSTILCRAPWFWLWILQWLQGNGFSDKTLSLCLPIVFTSTFQPNNSVGSFWGCGSQGWEIITWCARFTEQVLNITSGSPALRDRFFEERPLLQRIGRYRRPCCWFQWTQVHLRLFGIMTWFLSLSWRKGKGGEE